MPQHESGPIQVWIEKRESDLAVLPHLSKKTEAMKSRQRRQEYQLSRTMLLQMVGETVGAEPDSLRIENKDSGEPYIAGHTDLGISITHSPLLIGCALCDHKGFGIDIESIARFSTSLGRKEDRWLHPNEASTLNGLEGEDMKRALCKIWTSKEAYAKSKGQGLGIIFSEIDMTALPESEVEFRSFSDGHSILSVASARGAKLSWRPSLSQVSLPLVD